jgi:hypothetical protein
MISSDVADMTQIQAWLQAELPGMIRHIVEQLALDMLLTGPRDSDDAEDEPMQDSDVPDDPQMQSSDVPVVAPRRRGNVTDMAHRYDAARYYLGKLCPRQHHYEDTGLSLRYKKSKRCIACDTESARERRQAKAEQ